MNKILEILESKVVDEVEMFKIKWEDYEDVTWYVSGFANNF